MTAGLGINWARGAFRLWVVASVLWCTAILAIPLLYGNVTWFPSQAMVHVKISNTEQWDYPADWGVQQITEDLEARMAVLHEEERKWAAQVPASHKAECDAVPKDMKFDDYPANLQDCERLITANDKRSWWQGWESQVETAPKLAWWVLLAAIPYATTPPLATLVLGGMLFWAFRGFRPSSTE